MAINDERLREWIRIVSAVPGIEMDGDAFIFKVDAPPNTRPIFASCTRIPARSFGFADLAIGGFQMIYIGDCTSTKDNDLPFDSLNNGGGFFYLAEAAACSLFPTGIPVPLDSWYTTY